MPITSTRTALSAPESYRSGAYYEDHIGGPGGVESLFVANNGASDRWIFVFNLSAKPVDTTTTYWVYRVAAGDQIQIQLNFYFSTGLTWACSSTADALTYDAAGSFGVAAVIARGTV